LTETSLIIEHFRSKRKNDTVLYRLSEKYELYISAVTQFEFLTGAKEHQETQIRAVTDVFHILPFDSDCAEIASEISKSLRKKHLHTEFRDIFIAATAISANMPLATMNIKHFRNMEGLEIFNVDTSD